MANGKGSGRRPAAIPDAQVASEWERIFGHQCDNPMACRICVPDHPLWPAGLTSPLPLQRPALPPEIAPEPREQ